MTSNLKAYFTNSQTIFTIFFSMKCPVQIFKIVFIFKNNVVYDTL